MSSRDRYLAGRNAPSASNRTTADVDDADSRDEHRFMTALEAAGELQVSRATVHRLLQARVLPGRRFGKTLRVSRAAVRAYADDAGAGRP